MILLQTAANTYNVCSVCLPENGVYVTVDYAVLVRGKRGIHIRMYVCMYLVCRFPNRITALLTLLEQRVLDVTASVFGNSISEYSNRLLYKL